MQQPSRAQPDMKGLRTLAGGILPDYSGRSIGNVPATLLHALTGETPTDVLAPLAPSVLPPALLAGVERILLLVVDGLGWNQLTRAIEAGTTPTLADLAARGSLRPVTSVLPSTTASALSSLASGVAPRTHGITGYRTFLPHLATTINAVRMKPLLGGPGLFDMGLTPETFFPFPTVSSRLAQRGIETRVVTRSAYTHSPLTRMLYRDAHVDGYLGVGDMLVRARRAHAGLRDRLGFIDVYWDLVDPTAHAAGPESEEHDAEVAAFDHALGRELVRHVRDPATLLLVTADHGHTSVPEGNTHLWNDHPDVLRDLVHAPTGEGRLTYLAVRDGARERVREAVQRAFPGIADVFDAQDLVKQGAFGPGPDHPELHGRIGDLVVVVRDGHRLVHAPTLEKMPKLHVGNHGGTSPNEMIVPLLAARLG